MLTKTFIVYAVTGTILLEIPQKSKSEFQNFIKGMSKAPFHLIDVCEDVNDPNYAKADAYLFNLHLFALGE